MDSGLETAKHIRLLQLLLIALHLGRVTNTVQFAGLTVNPAVLRLTSINTTQPLIVYCNVTQFSDATSALMTMTLKRNQTGLPQLEEIGKVSRSQKGDTLSLTKLLPPRKDFELQFDERYKSLVLMLGRAECADATEYVCDVRVLNVTNDTTTVEIYSQNVYADIRPYWKSSIKGEQKDGIMRLTCSSFTLSYTNQVRWVWQTQKSGDALWEQASEVSIEDKAPPPYEHCTTPHTSVLVKQLTVYDSNKVYRCYVIDNKTDATFMQYAALFNIGPLDVMNYDIAYIIGGAVTGVFIFLIVTLIGYRTIILPRRIQLQKAMSGHARSSATIMTQRDGATVSTAKIKTTVEGTKI